MKLPNFVVIYTVCEGQKAQLLGCWHSVCTGMYIAVRTCTIRYDFVQSFAGPHFLRLLGLFRVVITIRVD